MSQPIIPLRPAVQHYDWGGFTYIPHLLGLANSAHRPFAELWMGDHHRGAARLELNGHTQSLAEWILAAPEERLGPAAVRAFGPRLPFLFKVLDVRQMLSIQTHPNQEQAQAGYQRENQQGVPLDAPNRLFKDPNHKPEVMVALSDFWLLHGFRHPADIKKTLRRIPELSALAADFPDNGLSSFFNYLMNLPQSKVDELLSPLRRRLRSKPPEDRSDLDFWAARAFQAFDSPEGHIDRGIFSLYLLNLVHLSPGQGIYQAAGIPHAYLEGVNVELMASSDNVFRGGLTSKHIDVPVLLAHLDFSAVSPRVLEGERVSPAEKRFPTPAPDFELSQIELNRTTPSYRHTSRGPEIILLLEGKVVANRTHHLRAGNCLFLPYQASCYLECQDQALLFKAALPDIPA